MPKKYKNTTHIINIYMKLAFITGITGQDGSYLTELLLKKDYNVFGIIRRTSLFNTTRIDFLREKITLRYGDLSDGAGLSNFINEIAKDQNGIKRVYIDPKYYRPCEVELLLGDARKAEEKLGWKRDYDTLDKLIADMFI